MRQFVRYFLNYLVNILPIRTLNFEILKLAISQAEKIKDSEIENEKLDIDNYKLYLKKTKTYIKIFYKGLKKLKSNNSYSDNDELYIFKAEKYHDIQFYKDNEENEKMEIFYQ